MRWVLFTIAPTMNPFLIYFLVSLVASLLWTLVAYRGHQLRQRPLGLLGAWAATLVLAAFWQADAVPWLWQLLTGVLLVWGGALFLVASSAASKWQQRQPQRLPLVSCAVISMGANVTACLHCLWLATVSPGGV
jgi:hypothetical protein